MTGLRVMFVVCTLAVAAADLAQPAVLGWRPAHVAALAGAALYLGLGVWALRGSRIALWIAVVMPVVPVSVIGASCLGLPVPVTPHAAMVGVLVLQLLTAVVGALTLRATRVASF